MLDELKHKLYALDRIVGAELHVQPDNSYSIRFVELSINNDVVKFSKGRNDLTTVNQLKNSIDHSIPVVLAITGKGIIQKKIDAISTENEVKLQQVLPNADHNEFYCQSYPCLGNQEFAAVIRKEVIEKIISEFEKEQVILCGVHIGPFIINSIVPLLAGNGELKFDQYEFVVKDSLLQSFQKTDNQPQPTTILLKGTAINELQLIAYAAAFELLITQQFDGIANETLAFNFTESLEKIKFKVHGWFVLLFFLLVLLINFFVFSHYNEKKQQLGTSNIAITPSQLDQLKKQVTVKEELVKDLGGNFPYKYAYLADNIASTVPSALQLNEFIINPFDERKSKEQKQKIADQGLIIIKGSSSDIQPINQWVGELKKLDFVERASVVNFEYDSNEQIGEFELTIKLKL